jgi:hypothetical protein
MLGTTGMESCNSKRWMHSRWGFELMEDRYFVGDLYEPSRDQEWLLRLNGSNTAGFSNEFWNLSVSQQISKTTWRYEFQNPKFWVRLDIPSCEWIGRHFILSKNQSKYRLYTNCTMLDANIDRWRKGLIAKYENLVEGAEHQVEDVGYPTKTNALPLVIKTYNYAKALSLEISKDNVGAKWHLQGPIVILSAIFQIFNSPLGKWTRN